MDLRCIDTINALLRLVSHSNLALLNQLFKAVNRKRDATETPTAAVEETRLRITTEYAFMLNVRAADAEGRAT